ncbi:MAG: RibD family protein [Oculatellaceae cyanobacterium bins.114]|nr:RibD family protein [Oculatellaceae cyanobacterium bins.114]
MGRSHTTVVLAMSADGKIADYQRSPARFGSPTDKAHLETQIALADAVLFGAETLRAYGTTLPIRQEKLLEQRQQQGKPPQPVHIVCSRSGKLDANYPFFSQPVPRWLLTTSEGAEQWDGKPGFDRLLTLPSKDGGLDWQAAFQEFSLAGFERVAVIGGGTLVASLLEADLIDEVWLTVCPLLLGGRDAPTLVEGEGFAAKLAPHLELLSVEAIAQEVFLHYRIQRVA